jgi:hypothetical protein
MPSAREKHPIREAARGVALLTGLAVGTVTVATVIAFVFVTLMG